jgi:hypothetical protein
MSVSLKKAVNPLCAALKQAVSQGKSTVRVSSEPVITQVCAPDQYDVRMGDLPHVREPAPLTKRAWYNGLANVADSLERLLGKAEQDCSDCIDGDALKAAAQIYRDIVQLQGAHNQDLAVQITARCTQWESGQVATHEFLHYVSELAAQKARPVDWHYAKRKRA